MPGRPRRPKRRRSSGVLIETTPNLRQKQFPSPKQTIRPKNSPWSLPPTRQQTITQMDPFFSQCHPELEQENVDYDDAGDTYVEPMRKVKRRKMSYEDTPLRRVTRSAKKPTATHEPTSELQSVPGEDLPTKAPKTNTTMPPPRTPARSRRREIPSSQSPADTPVSTQSRRTISPKSPLKAKSTNINVAASPTTTPKRVRWALKREVADSMDSEGGLSRVASKSSSESLKTDLGLVKSPTTSQGRSEQRDAAADVLAGPIHRALLPDSVIQVPSSPPAQEEAFESTDIGSPPINTNPVRFEYYPSDSQEASHRRLGDLQRTTLPPAQVQTESQFEDGWQSYHPPQPSSNSLPSSLRYVPSSQLPPTSDSEKEWASTISTQPLPQSLSARVPKQPVPPSQATTIDVTQATPRKTTQRGLPSSPPPIPPSSSSPVFTRNSLAGSEWNNEVRLTDTQLFPESLLNDSIYGPPEGWRMMKEDGDMEEEAD